MSHGGDDDIGAQAWPGFVDILSSTMIMFVFFLMITATALFFHTMMFKSKLLSHNEEVVTARVNKAVKELITENQSLKEEIQELKQKSAAAGGNVDQEQKVKLMQQAAEFADSVDQEVKTSANDKEITVFFGTDAISLTKNTTEEITKFLKQFENQKVKFVVTASKEPDERLALTARKVSVARMLNVRNQLIQAKITPSDIDATIVGDSADSEKGDWVKIAVKSK